MDSDTLTNVCIKGARDRIREYIHEARKTAAKCKDMSEEERQKNAADLIREAEETVEYLKMAKENLSIAKRYGADTEVLEERVENLGEIWKRHVEHYEKMRDLAHSH